MGIMQSNDEAAHDNQREKEDKLPEPTEQHAPKCASCNDSREKLREEVICDVLHLISTILTEDPSETPSYMEKVSSFGWDVKASVERLKTVRLALGDSCTRPAQDEIAALQVQVQEICHDRSLTQQDVSHNTVLEHEELNSKIKKLETELATMTKNQHDFKNSTEKDMAVLRKENAELFLQNDELNQYDRRDIMEIHNIPLQEDENTLTEVLDFYYYEMGIDVKSSEISVCHRQFIPKGQEWLKGSKLHDPTCPPIYVKFALRKRMTGILKMKKRLYGCKNRNGFRILINENLTEYRRHLMSEVKSTLKDWKYVWCKNGNIKARKNHGDRPYTINSYEKLYDIVDFDQI